MVKKIILEDTVILYWDRDKDFLEGYKYCITCGKKIAYTKKTHYEIEQITNEKSLKIAVSMVNQNNVIIKEYECETIYLLPAKRKLDVTKPPYNAIGDGKTVNTVALQRALDDCKSDEIVYIPQGTFLTGALNMHSDTELYLAENAVLQGTENVNDYLPKIKSRFEGTECLCYRSLINIGELDRHGGYNCKNVVIRGKGAILGGGKALMENIIKRETSCDCVNENNMEHKEKEARRTRGRLINMSNAQNIVIYGIEAGMAPAWNIHMIYSDNIVTAGCYIHSEEVSNGDGWDPDSSTNCTIFNCDFNTRDDMVAIKSGKNPEGNVINRPSCNIRVFDCRCTMGHGLAIGSEISGGVENVQVWDCEMESSRCGLEIKATKQRGGYVKGVSVYNSSFSILAIRSVGYNCDGIAAPQPPIFEDYYFENINLTGVCIKHTGETWDEAAIITEGFDAEGFELKNVTLKNIKIKRREHNPNHAIKIASAVGINMENITCE